MGEYAINIYKQQFTQADVLRAINAPFKPMGEEGLSSMTLNNWIKRGHLPKLSEHSPGSGRRRLFSAKDAVQIAALMYMTNLKIPVSDASNLLYFFREQMDKKVIGLSPEMGELSLVLMAKSNGELLAKPVYENDADGNPTDVSILNNLPGLTLINVDFIIELIAEELFKILTESGEAEEQEDNGLSSDIETERYWRKLFSESVIELEELEQKTKDQDREPTSEEQTRMFELRRNIEDGKLILKSRRRNKRLDK